MEGPLSVPPARNRQADLSAVDSWRATSSEFGVG